MPPKTSSAPAAKPSKKNEMKKKEKTIEVSTFQKMFQKYFTQVLRKRPFNVRQSSIPTLKKVKRGFLIFAKVEFSTFKLFIKNFFFELTRAYMRNTSHFPLR